MRQKNFLLSSRIAMLLLSLIFILNTSISAEAAPTTTKQSAAYIPSSAPVEVSTLYVDKKNGIPVELARPQFSIMANYNITGTLLNHNDSLTAADPTDFYFFSVSDPRMLIFKIQSANPNYRVDLYQIDWNANTAYPAGLGSTSGNDALAGIGSGDWAVQVTSTGSVGNAYTIQLNASAPGGANSLMDASATLQSVIWSYPNKDLYMNDSFIANTSNTADINPHLKWTRVFENSEGGNYQTRTHDIDDVRVSSITTRVNYSSNYASSNNAVLIVLNEGTLFTYSESKFQSSGGYALSFVDLNGRPTPRRFDFIDMAGDPDILVYDLNTNKVIDFVSNLNYYYAKGIEPFPSVTYYP